MGRITLGAGGLRPCARRILGMIMMTHGLRARQAFTIERPWR
jgi:hypothetical protein